MGVPLATERLWLRPLTLDDGDVLVALAADAEVMRHINGGRPPPPAEIRRVLAATADHRWLAVPGAGG